MTGFDLTIRLFGLLLGLAIAEVLGGFARTLQLKADIAHVSASDVRIGWLVPLLGFQVVMDQTGFWMNFYVLQSHVPGNFLAILCVLFVVGGFYVVSTFVFPADPKLWPDFDEYYFRIYRIVIGGLLAVNVVVLAFAFALLTSGVELHPVSGTRNPVADAAALLYLPTLTALLFVKGKRLSLVLLVVANGCLLVEAITMAR